MWLIGKRGVIRTVNRVRRPLPAPQRRGKAVFNGLKACYRPLRGNFGMVQLGWGLPFYEQNSTRHSPLAWGGGKPVRTGFSAGC